MKKKNIKKTKKKSNILTNLSADVWGSIVSNTLGGNLLFTTVTRGEPYPTCSICEVDYENFEKEIAEDKKKEAIRRAKKITMTVGEFEDKLDEASNYYD